MDGLCNSILLFSVLLIFQICVGYTENTYSKARCMGSEGQALLEFKAGLVDSGNRLSSWVGKDCCDWEGITCNNRTGHVEKLDLHNPGNASLGGEINRSLLNLEHLQYLDLSANNFSGIPIPAFLGSLKNVKYLNLSSAEFDGEIPRHLGNLSNLQYLGLSSYGFTVTDVLTAKNLRWITGLSSLQSLDLSGVNLAESSDWLDSVNMLPSLISLELRGCQLVGGVSPPNHSPLNLSSLLLLDLGENGLNSTFPSWLLNLSNQLAVLRLDNNFFQGPIPSKFWDFTSLTSLDLSQNSFSSLSVPSSLCNQSGLLYVNLGYNKIQDSLPLCLGRLNSLRVLNLTNNNFDGNLPSELGRLKQLSTLDLSFNSFKSSIPSNFGQLKELKFLYLQHNQLNSTVPSTLGSLTNLQVLDISHNSLTGALLESHFVDLKSLKLLSISQNFFLTFNVSSHWNPPFQLREIYMDSVFVGTQFPNWLRTQKSISILSLVNCSVFGAIPEWFRTTSVKDLYLSSNKIDGPLISFPPEMHLLDLSKNYLSGPIHLFDARSTNNLSLGVLKLGNNNLTGSIPTYICSLAHLSILSLANNHLTGEIPLCFGDFGNYTQLNVLDLSNNSLSGQIPSTLGQVQTLMFLHLNGNKLSGMIPSALKNLIFLFTLDLGENQLTGTIPDWIAKDIPSLRFLRLQSNNFHGNIPTDLCRLSMLQILNLAENSLVGSIPQCFNNLTMMVSNDLTELFTFDAYAESLWSIVKGVELEYSSNLLYVKSLSLSANSLHGEIPNELMELKGLQSLNLSINNLSGTIPEKIGNLKNLESLDLALNHLSGPIPQSLADIDSLSYLNLSFNNLSGRIPSGNHFDTLSNRSIYEGNTGLCGKVLGKTCPGDVPPKEKGDQGFQQRVDDNDFEFLWFYSGLAPGFAMGFLGAVCILHLKKSWRLAYTRFLENICYRMCY